MSGTIAPMEEVQSAACQKSSLVMAKKRKFDPAAFLAEGDVGRTVSNYRRAQVIFAQDDSAESVFFIQRGRVKLSVISERGKEAVVGFLGASDFIGEACLNHRPRRMATASAITDCVITEVAKSTMIKALRDEPKLSAQFMVHLLSRTVRVEEDLVDQLFNSSEKRLARALLLLANFGKEGAPEPIDAKITQETLAEMIGTTRSRVSYFMNKFRRLGFIDYNGELRVHSSLLDVVLYDKPEIKSRR
jgi:CRP/FNR family cyclic AMP-dependent transcriptional regulator